MRKERILFFVLLAFVIGVMIYSPLHYGFVYPTGGDDTAHHITNIKNLTSDFSYIRKLPYYGTVLLTPFTYLGLSPLAVFHVFNYAVIVAMFLSLWALARRFYGLLSAVLSFYITVFIVRGTWYYFEDGTIFNILNLWVFGILAVYGLCRWLDSGRCRWLILSGFLFVIASLTHSTTYLYLLAAMLLFIFGYAVFRYIKKDKLMLKRVLIFGGVFCLSIITAWATWMHKALPSLGKPMVKSITQGTPSFVTPVDYPGWGAYYLGTGAAILLAVSVIIILIMLLKGKTEENQSVINRLNQPVSYILLSLIIVLTLGTFTKLGYNSDRFARDLATILGLSTAVFLGIILTHYRYKFNYLTAAVLLAVMITSSSPLLKWLDNYSAVQSCDIQAADYLNKLSDSEVEVQISPTIAPWIYELFTDDNIIYTGVSNLDNYREARYILFRNRHMTWGTETHMPQNYKPLTLWTMNDVTQVAEFTSEEYKVTIYKVNPAVAENPARP